MKMHMNICVRTWKLTWSLNRLTFRDNRLSNCSPMTQWVTLSGIPFKSFFSSLISVSFKWQCWKFRLISFFTHQHCKELLNKKRKKKFERNLLSCSDNIDSYWNTAKRLVRCLVIRVVDLLKSKLTKTISGRCLEFWLTSYSN